MSYIVTLIMVLALTSLTGILVSLAVFHFLAEPLSPLDQKLFGITLILWACLIYATYLIYWR